MPWWAAVLIAVTSAAAGIAFDAGSGDRELTNVFAALYLLGCVAAVLAVRRAGIFTAVVQPPLILFVAVPSAYFLFHHSEIHGIKDLLINCGYPLIERFLLMFSTSVIVLVIGLTRWYFGAAGRTSATATEGAATAAAGAAAVGVTAGLRARFTALLGRPAVAGDAADEHTETGTKTNTKTDTEKRSRRHAVNRQSAGAKTDTRRPAEKRAAAGRSRQPRPAPDDRDAPPPRRRRPGPAREADRVDDLDGLGGHRGADRPDDPRPPRRRPRPPRDEALREPPPRPRQRGPRDAYNTRDARDPRDAHEDPYAPPMRRRSRYDSPEDLNGARPYERRDPYESPAPRRRSPDGGTHHPFSHVRYRGESAGDGDDRVEYRRRPSRHRLDADDWRYGG